MERGRGVGVQSDALLDPGPFTSPESQAHGAPSLSTSSWSRVLNLLVTTHGIRGRAGRGGCVLERGAKHSALPRRSRLPRDFPSRLARSREERARFVSRLAPGTFPRKIPMPRPKLPLPQPRPQPSPWRRPASAATAALSYRRCLGGARKPCSQTGSHAEVSVAGSGARPERSQAAPRVCGRRGACPELWGVRAGTHSVPPRRSPSGSGSPPRCRSPGPRGWAGQGGSS